MNGCTGCARSARIYPRRGAGALCAAQTLRRPGLAVCLGLTVLFAVLAVLTFNPRHAACAKGLRLAKTTTLVLVFLSIVAFPGLRTHRHDA